MERIIIIADNNISAIKVKDRNTYEYVYEKATNYEFPLIDTKSIDDFIDLLLSKYNSEVFGDTGEEFDFSLIDCGIDNQLLIYIVSKLAGASNLNVYSLDRLIHLLASYYHIEDEGITLCFREHYFKIMITDGSLYSEPSDNDKEIVDIFDLITAIYYPSYMGSISTEEEILNKMPKEKIAEKIFDMMVGDYKKFDSIESYFEQYNNFENTFSEMMYPYMFNATKWFAEQGDVYAQGILGNFYYFGLGVEGNKTEAVVWYRKAAKLGNALAQCRLGDCCYNGDGVDENKFEALSWYIKAAEQGNAVAQNRLGFCYFTGMGIEENKSKAVAWYRKAAEQGNDVAQYRLGNCYANGEGVEKNMSEAVVWYRNAADQGNKDAKRALERLWWK